MPIDVRIAEEEGALELGGVLETYAKSLDTGAKPAMIVAIPAASAEAYRSAGAFGVLLVEGDSEEAVVESAIRVLTPFLG